jgi:hypothetical protein
LVRFWFYKAKTERTELKKTGKKPSQTGKNRVKPKNRAKPEKTKPNQEKPSQTEPHRNQSV